MQLLVFFLTFSVSAEGVFNLSSLPTKEGNPVSAVALISKVYLSLLVHSFATMSSRTKLKQHNWITGNDLKAIMSLAMMKIKFYVLKIVSQKR